MGKLSISRILIIFGILVTAGLALSIGLQTLALQKLKINGAAYNDIIAGKDLVADILPPPLFLVEAYSLASEAAIHTELAKANAAKIRSLKNAYDLRRAVWKDSNLPADIKLKLENDVLSKGDIFWEDVQQDYLKAAEAGDTKGVHSAMDKLKDEFHAHEAAVVELVTMSNAYMVQSSTAADTLATRLGALAIGGSLLSVTILFAGLWFMRMRAISPLTRISDYMTLLSQGDYSKDVPLKDRQDEIGSMAKSVDIFRAAAVERQRLRREMEADRALSEEQKLERERIRIQEAAQLKVVVDTLGAGLGRLAECNIRLTIDEPFVGDFDALRHDFNNSIATFQSTLEQVLAKTAHLYGNSQEMREAADNLSKRTEQQAAALEQTAAALEEVTSTVRSSVERTAETRTLVREAKECTMASGAVVRQAVEAMTRIKGASSEIAQIIDVIDQIAFQTNLLALNAGVEAARAGDAGKGFAVVAQEVRELAQRSAKAAKEISTLISNSSSEVANGVKLVGETGVALGKIEGYVSEIDVKVDAITEASREQAIGLNEISGAVNSVDQMTQQNAAMVEETTAISHSLAADSKALTELVNRFQLNRRSAIREPGKPFSRRMAA